MLQGWVILSVSFAYLAILFGIAFYGDKYADQGRSLIATPYIYSLSLAVYATSWTFYGSVGRAAVSGPGFLPIYLGPTLAAALGWIVLRKMIRISKANRITSIADFAASRYGKSPFLGGLVTVIAVVGIVPYIALQLKAISNSLAVLLAFPEVIAPAKLERSAVFDDTTLYIALLLSAFTILFGTRHLEATERHEGMVAAIAFESVIKLVAFVLVGLFVTFVLFDGVGDVFSQARERPELAALMTFDGSGQRAGSWASLTLLSALAVLLLPRQFQIGVVENVNERHVSKAIWLFPLYLFAINLFVLPIAFGGMMLLGASGADADAYVLTLPMSQGWQGLALFVFIGGLSAATGMVIVETIALSTMVSNDLAVPLLLRLRRLRITERADLSGLILGIRRGAIVVILLLGYAYFRAAGEAHALVAIGLMSFAAVAQFAPAILGGMYWRGGTRAGAIAGLVAGFVCWIYTLALPSFAKSGWLPLEFLELGPFGIELLKPQQLFGLRGLDEISHCMFWSLFANAGLYVGISLFTRQTAMEARQAIRFVEAFRDHVPVTGHAWTGGVEAGALVELVARFLGVERARQVFDARARSLGLGSASELKSDADLIHFTEFVLAGAIGASSARVIVASVVEEAPPGIDEVMHILDETSQVRAYSRQLEEKSVALERASADLREANDRLQELDRMKDDFISTVTHELRTPLTSIRAFSEILHDNPDLDSAERMRFLSIIIRESERLTRLINQVLDLAKLESGSAEWHPALLDLREVVEDSLAATSQLFRDRSIDVAADYDPDLPRITADRDRLVQVMLNLLSNAAKFCDQETGRIRVRLSRSDDALRVDVTDNGPGVAPDDQNDIFEKFRQVASTAAGKPVGTGLGLPISRQIITHFGGRLWVESEPGKGARFSFTLPLEPPRDGMRPST
jgi:Na+/proline symporter/nitrogen-specific signal transduction histidine kinase